MRRSDAPHASRACSCPCRARQRAGRRCSAKRPAYAPCQPSQQGEKWRQGVLPAEVEPNCAGAGEREGRVRCMPAALGRRGERKGSRAPHHQPEALAGPRRFERLDAVTLTDDFVVHMVIEGRILRDDVHLKRGARRRNRETVASEETHSGRGRTVAGRGRTTPRIRSGSAFQTLQRQHGGRAPRKRGGTPAHR